MVAAAERAPVLVKAMGEMRERESERVEALIEIPGGSVFLLASS